jgi:hypothetical protein
MNRATGSFLQRWPPQVVFLHLSYPLRQWQLWKTRQEQLAGLHPRQIQRRLDLESQFVVNLARPVIRRTVFTAWTSFNLKCSS